MQLASVPPRARHCLQPRQRVLQRPGTRGTWVWGLGSAVVRPTSSPCPVAASDCRQSKQQLFQEGGVEWSRQLPFPATLFPVHVQRVLPMRTEVKRNQTKALFSQGCFFFFFKELVTISVQQELHQMFKIEVYLGCWEGRKVCSLK